MPATALVLATLLVSQNFGTAPANHPSRPAVMHLGDEQAPPASGQFVSPPDLNARRPSGAAAEDRTASPAEFPRGRLGSPVGATMPPANENSEPAQVISPRHAAETTTAPNVLHGNPGVGNLGVAVPASHLSNTNLAATLLERALTPPRERALRGRAVTLVEGLSQSSGSGRAVMIKRYWAASMKIAEYHSAIDELARVTNLPAPQTADQKGVLTGAHAAARARLDETEALAVAAQYELADSLGGAHLELPPIPTEIPLAAAYRTHFETLFADRAAPPNIRRLHESLPIYHKALQSRAEAVIAAEEAEGAVEDAFRRGTTDINGVLAAHEAIRAQRKYFFRIALDYNQFVADYALAVVGSDLPANTLVSTLVETPIIPAGPAMRSVLVGGEGEIRQASRLEPLGDGNWQIKNSPAVRYPVLGEAERAVR